MLCQKDEARPLVHSAVQPHHPIRFTSGDHLASGFLPRLHASAGRQLPEQPPSLQVDLEQFEDALTSRQHRCRPPCVRLGCLFGL